MRVSASQGHTLWAPFYDATPNPVLALEARILRGVLPPLAPRLFVDVACGTGRWMAYLRERDARVIGLDLCAEMLAQAAVKPGLRGRLAIAEAAQLPLENEVADVALCSFAAGYISQLGKVVAEMARITKCGGRVILTDLHPEAVAAGWTRSFRIACEVYDMEHFARPLEDIRSAGQDAGLCLHIQIESGLGDPERLIFRMAGKEHLFEEAARVPAVWACIWNKR